MVAIPLAMVIENGYLVAPRRTFFVLLPNINFWHSICVGAKSPSDVKHEVEKKAPAQPSWAIT
jgi:hypothetical protein